MALSTARRMAAALATVAAVVALGMPGALAHGGGARFEVLEAAEVAPGEVEVRVAVAHESDQHPAEGAIVEVAATGPDGAAVAPQPAERQEEPDTYAATLQVSSAGDWVVTLTSSFPEGSLEVPVAVALEAGAEPTTATSTTVGPTAPATDGTPTTVVPVAGVAEDDDTANLVIAAVFGLIGGALGLWVSNRRGKRKRDEAAGRS